MVCGAEGFNYRYAGNNPTVAAHDSDVSDLTSVERQAHESPMRIGSSLRKRHIIPKEGERLPRNHSLLDE
jgi:hypothetical protein